MYPFIGYTATSTNGTVDVTANFGQKPFKFPPPEGYQPLNAANVRPVKVISRPDQYVGVTTYTGNSTGKSIEYWNSNQIFFGLNQGQTLVQHAIQDSVRGSAKCNYRAILLMQKALTLLQLVFYHSFDRNGFTLGTESSATGSTNGSQSYVAWAWKAGGNKNTFNVDDVGYASAAAAGLDGGIMTVTGCLCWNQTRI